MTTHSKEALEALSSAALVAHYNAMAAMVRTVGIEQNDVRRFADKTTAVKRCGLMEQLVTDQEELEVPALPVGEPSEIVPETLRQDTLAQQQAAMDAVRTHQPEEESDMAAAKKAARKPAPRKTKVEGAPRGLAEDAKIRILVKDNPRRGEAAKRFEIYKDGMTVAEYTKKIGSRAEALVHLRWDIKHGHISVK